MGSDPIPEALLSLAGGFVPSLFTVISFHTLHLVTPPGIYYSIAIISLLTLVLVSFGAAAIFLIYVLFMFIHGYIFVDVARAKGSKNKETQCKTQS